MESILKKYGFGEEVSIESIKDGVVLTIPKVGDLKYEHGWVGSLKRMWRSSSKETILIFEAHSDQMVTDIQLEAFSKSQKQLKKDDKSLLKGMVKYIEKEYNLPNPVTEENLFEIIKVKALNFNRDGSWGVIFETNFDKENEMAIWFIKGKWEIGFESDFL